MSGTVKWGIQVEGATALKRALRVLSETDAPFLREALTESGQLLRGAAARRAPGGIANKVDFVGVKGSGGTLRALIQIKHPGGMAMEFGRSLYYRGFTKRRMKATGRRFRASPGQKARPYLGITKGDAAIGEVGERIKRLILQAIQDEWERIGREGD